MWISLECPGRSVDRSTLRDDTEPGHVLDVGLGQCFGVGGHDHRGLCLSASSLDTAGLVLNPVPLLLRPQIGRGLEATYQTIFRHLQELEKQGLVDSDGSKKRHGQRVVYRLNKEERDRALTNYAKYLAGQ